MFPCCLTQSSIKHWTTFSHLILNNAIQRLNYLSSHPATEESEKRIFTKTWGCPKSHNSLGYIYTLDNLHQSRILWLQIPDPFHSIKLSPMLGLITFLTICNFFLIVQSVWRKAFEAFNWFLHLPLWKEFPAGFSQFPQKGEKQALQGLTSVLFKGNCLLWLIGRARVPPQVKFILKQIRVAFVYHDAHSVKRVSVLVLW